MILSRDSVDDLRGLAAIWPVDMVLIGATALVFSHGMRWRTTSDLDLVLAIEVDDLRRTLPAGWARTRLPHRIIGAHGTKFDLVPASPSLRSAGQVEWDDGVVMNLTGIGLAFRYADERVILDHRLKIAPPAVIAVLKMISYLDRPAERTRDLNDLAHLLAEYVGADDDRRFDEGLGLDLDFDLVPAYLLGKDAGELVASDVAVVAAVERFRVSVAGSEWGRVGPASWRRHDTGPEDHLTAFGRGFDEGQRRAPRH